MKRFFKKATALLCALFMTVSVVAQTMLPAVATSLLNQTYLVRPINGTLGVESEKAKWGTTFSYTDVTGASYTLDAGKTFARLDIDADAALCLMLGTSVTSGSTYTANGKLGQIWSGFSEAQKDRIAAVISFGQPDKDREHYYATQLLVWEITCGFRNCNSSNFETSVSLLNYADFSNTSLNMSETSGLPAIYKEIATSVKNWFTAPSCLSQNGTNYTLSYNPSNNAWYGEFTDSNGVLANYSLKNSNSAHWTVAKVSGEN